MHPLASELLIKEQLNRKLELFERENIQVNQDGLLVEAIFTRKSNNEQFKFMLDCYSYPFEPLEAKFVPIGLNPKVVNWPYDNEHSFRIDTSANHIPFICMPGLKSYSPENLNTTPYSRSDINIVTIIYNINMLIQAVDCSSKEVPL